VSVGVVDLYPYFPYLLSDFGEILCQMSQILVLTLKSFVKIDIGKAEFSYGHLESENSLGKYCALRHEVGNLFVVFLFSRGICDYGFKYVHLPKKSCTCF